MNDTGDKPASRRIRAAGWLFFRIHAVTAHTLLMEGYLRRSVIVRSVRR